MRVEQKPSVVKIRGYAIAAPDTHVLGDDAMAEILALCERPVRGLRSLRASGNCVVRGEISNVGEVVVKHYRRGGMLRKVVSRRYLRWGGARSFVEMQLLNQVNTWGVRAPRPVAAVWRGGVFYRGWLVTECLPSVQNLCEVLESKETPLETIVDDVVRQIGILISHRLYHVDLHPGNVLVGPQHETYLVDFDKACTFSGGADTLRDLYLYRWRRAVIKHGLPDEVCELMCSRLRRRFEIHDGV